MSDKTDPSEPGKGDGEPAKQPEQNLGGQVKATAAGQARGAVSKRPPLARRPGSSSLQQSAERPARQFKKCMSATFQIDGHYYTIGRSLLFMFCCCCFDFYTVFVIFFYYGALVRQFQSMLHRLTLDRNETRRGKFDYI